VDARGDDSWARLRTLTVPARDAALVLFTPAESGAWIRLTARSDAAQVTAFFHYRGTDLRTAEAAALFDGVAKPSPAKTSGGLLHARGAHFKTLRFIARNAAGELGCYDLDGELRLQKTNDPAGAAWTTQAVACPKPLIHVEGGAALYVDPQGRRWRLPRGEAALDHAGPLGPERVCREICTERNLLNVAGTFYELPAENAGGFIKLRPIATHNRRISDFASYRGLLVISGINEDAQGAHILRSDDGRCALWAGAVDDLWAFGKPRGSLGVWQNAPVKAGTPSDACLATGYDRKRLLLSQAGNAPWGCRIEADFTGTGKWSVVTRLSVPASQPLEYRFPEAFGAYWVRLVPEAETTVSATLVYE
jgi:hypothetical protein